MNTFSILFGGKTIDPNYDFSKDEEISLVEKLSEVIPPHSYLAELFTPELVGYVRENIKSDIMPNVMESLDASKAEARNFEVDLSIYKRRDNDNKDLIARLREENKESVTSILCLSESYTEAMGKIRELEAIIGQRVMEAEANEAKITALKARIYDYEHPES